MKIQKYEIHVGGNLDNRVDGVRIRLEFPDTIGEVDKEVSDILNDIKDKITCLEDTLKRNNHLYRNRDEVLRTYKEPIKGRWK